METPLTNNSVNLRPMGIRDLLGRAISFYRTHFLALVTLIALFTLPFAFLYAVASWLLLGPYLSNLQVFDPKTFNLVEYFSRLLAILALSFVGYLILPLQAAGVGVAMQGFLLTGRRVSLSEMLGGIRTHLSALLITGLVAIVLQLLLFLTFIIPPVGMVFFTLFFCSFSLAPYAVLYEQMQGLEAIRRSWLLIRGHFWRVIGYLLLLYLAKVIVAVAIGAVLGTSEEFLSFLANNPGLGHAVQTLPVTVASLLISPFSLSVIALLYFDLRIRNEGLDVAQAAAQAAGEPLDLAAIPRNEEPALNRETRKAVGILSAIYIELFVLFVLFCGGIFLIFQIFLIFEFQFYESNLPTSSLTENFDASQLISQVAESLAISYTSTSPETPCRTIFSSFGPESNIECNGNFELQSQRDAQPLLEGVFAEIQKEIQGQGQGRIISDPINNQGVDSFHLKSCQDLYDVKSSDRWKICTTVRLYFVSQEERVDAIAYTYRLTIDEQALKTTVPILKFVYLWVFRIFPFSI